MRMRNELQAISTNFGTVSEEYPRTAACRSVWIPRGCGDRNSPIGNRGSKIFPANKERICARLRGMVETVESGRVRQHQDCPSSLTQWAKVIGGILKINAFSDFVSNYGVRKTSDDPIGKPRAPWGRTSSRKRIAKTRENGGRAVTGPRSSVTRACPAR